MGNDDGPVAIIELGGIQNQEAAHGINGPRWRARCRVSVVARVVALWIHGGGGWRRSQPVVKQQWLTAAASGEPRVGG